MKTLILNIAMITATINCFSQSSLRILFDDAKMKAKIGDYQGALTDYKKLLKTDPKFAYMFAYSGFTSEELRDNIVKCSKLIELDSKFVYAYYSRGLSKANMNDYHGAVADFSKVLETTVTIAEIYHNRGHARAKLNDFVGAINDFSKAIEIDPSTANYHSRAYAKAELQDYRGAIDDYSNAIKVDPKYSAAYYWRGIYKIKLGQKDSGCLDLSKAGELGNPAAYKAISELCN